MKIFGFPGARLGLFSAALVSLTVSPLVRAQTLVLYDSFTATTVSPAAWSGDDGRLYGGSRGEEVRSIVSGQAHMELRTWGDVTSNAGYSNSRTALLAVKSVDITAMQAGITMRSETSTACSTNAAQPSQARARLFGFYFNAGTPAPGSNFNDVYAGAQIYRSSNSTDPVGTLRVSAFVGICTDDACIGSNSLGSLDMGTVALNAPTTLKVIWDKVNNKFSFQRDANAVVAIPYTVADAHLASFPAKRLEVSNIVPRCTATPRPSVFTSADFDNVYTNALP